VKWTRLMYACRCVKDDENIPLRYLSGSSFPIGQVSGRRTPEVKKYRTVTRMEDFLAFVKDLKLSNKEAPICMPAVIWLTLQFSFYWQQE
jgi:hypothetical protein